MKLTKYQHACFTLEKNGEVLAVDPGVFTNDFTPPEHVTAVVITHEHPDHFNREQLETIVAKSPHVTIVGHDSIMQQINDLQTISVNAGDTITIGDFELEFFGGKHAVIHESLPPVSNLAVMIDDTLYYPGDSFTEPKKPVAALALPVAAPWMKISEAIDFLAAVQPKLAFPTHDAILSNSGKSAVDGNIAKTKAADIDYRRLDAPVEL